LPVTIDIYDDTNALEQLRWQARRFPPDIDGTGQVRMSEAYAVARHKVLSQMKNAD
jgi:hypothetical protein